MTRLLLSLATLLILSVTAGAQSAPDAPELTKLLNDFLAGAGRNDVNIHENFWADDLIYTGAAGRRTSKEAIVTELRKAPPATSGPKTVYTAEDIRIQQYGDTAIVAFRLVSTVERGNKTEVAKFFNTGTFLKRNGKWQVVAWQATRLPQEDSPKTGVAETDAAIHRAVLAADVEALANLLDPSFVWTHANGEQMNHQALIGYLKAGQLKFSKLDTSNMTVSVSGDTAVVRGVAQQQRSAIPGQQAAADQSPVKLFYTLTLVNRNGPWKAVALHSSRP